MNLRDLATHTTRFDFSADHVPTPGAGTPTLKLRCALALFVFMIVAAPSLLAAAPASALATHPGLHDESANADPFLEFRQDLDPEDLQKNLVKIINTISAATVRVETKDGMGSGTIIRKDGLILTSAHVIEGSENVTVTLTNGRRLKAKVLGINGAGDLAVLKIKANGLTPVALSTKDSVSARQWVVAVGHPVSAFDDFQPTVSVGVVSRTNGTIRAEQNKVFFNAIVSDTPLSPGSSGGGLFNLDGQLIGVNAAVTPDERGAFTVRIREFLQDAARLFKGERFDRRATRGPWKRRQRAASRSRNSYFNSNFAAIQQTAASKRLYFSIANRVFSGFLVSASGQVLTTSRAVAGLDSGTELAAGHSRRELNLVAKLVGIDATNDVALIQMPERKLPYPYFDIDKNVIPQRGQLAMAMNRRYVTGGLVGSAKRTPPTAMTDGVYYPHVLQVDLRLRRRDLGAPVCNTKGQLLGMVVQYRLTERLNEVQPYGAFLTPLKLLRESRDLLVKGRVRGQRNVAMLGVDLEELTESQLRQRQISGGVYVKGAPRGYAAYRAGIRAGDVITSIGGVAARSRGVAVAHIASFQGGDTVEIQFRRGGRSFKVEVEFGRRGEPSAVGR